VNRNLSSFLFYEAFVRFFSKKNWLTICAISTVHLSSETFWDEVTFSIGLFVE